MTDPNKEPEPEHTLFLEDAYQARRAQGMEAQRTRQGAALERLQAAQELQDEQDPAARSRQIRARALARARQQNSERS